MSKLTRVFMDVISLILTFLPVMSAYLLTIYLYLHFHHIIPVLLFIFFAPFIVTLTFIAITFFLRVCLPKLESGQYELRLNKAVLTWYCHLALNRSSKILGLRYLINSFFFLKFLHLRSLGAKVTFDLNTSLDYVIADLPLITIGKNCTLGHNLYISCHLIKGSRLFLMPVIIGDDVSIGMNCVIGPGSRIGSGTRVDFGNNIYGVRLDEGTTLGPNEWFNGPPSKRSSI